MRRPLEEEKEPRWALAAQNQRSALRASADAFVDFVKIVAMEKVIMGELRDNNEIFRLGTKSVILYKGIQEEAGFHRKRILYWNPVARILIMVCELKYGGRAIIDAHAVKRMEELRGFWENEIARCYVVLVRNHQDAKILGAQGVNPIVAQDTAANILIKMRHIPPQQNREDPSSEFWWFDENFDHLHKDPEMQPAQILWEIPFKRLK